MRNAFSKLVAHAHPTTWLAIDSLRKVCAMAATGMLQSDQGERPKKRIRLQTRPPGQAMQLIQGLPGWHEDHSSATDTFSSHIFWVNTHTHNFGHRYIVLLYLKKTTNMHVIPFTLISNA